MNWAAGRLVLVEACTSMADPEWIPVAMSLLADGTGTFEDTGETNAVGRFYRAIPAP